MMSRVECLRSDGMYVLVLTKTLDGLPWDWQPGGQEQILDAMTEELGGSYEVINALIGLGELLAGAGEMAAFLPPRAGTSEPAGGCGCRLRADGWTGWADTGRERRPICAGARSGGADGFVRAGGAGVRDG